MLTLLTDLSSSFYNRYLVSLRNITQNMGTKIDVPSENLVPVASLTSVLTLLRELIICQKSLHGHEENTNEEPVAVTVIVLEPLLQMCNETASHVLPNVPTSTATYLLNCLYLIRNTLFSGESQAGDDPRSDLLNRQVNVMLKSAYTVSDAWFRSATLISTHSSDRPQPMYWSGCGCDHFWIPYEFQKTR